MAAIGQYDGPQRPTADQLPAVVALADRVFLSPGERSMGDQFPLLFHAERLEQLFIFTSDGRPVSLVGMMLDDAVLLGCDVRVACLGSVCTDEAHRGQGLAGRLTDAAVDQAVAAGASVMLISGNRTLYSRRGAFGDGLFDRYEVPADSLPQPDGTLSLVPAASGDMADVLTVFEREPIRFRRDAADYATRIAAGHVMCGESETYVVRRSGHAVAVLSLHLPRDAGDALVVRELAGSRRAAVSAASDLARASGASGLHIDAYPSDCELRDVCGALGVEPNAAGFHGTVKVLDAERLWSEFARLVRDRMGWAAADGLRFHAEADELKVHTVTFERSGERVRVQGARDVTACLFGSREVQPLADVEGALATDLRSALPLPLPLYGLNYV